MTEGDVKRHDALWEAIRAYCTSWSIDCTTTHEIATINACVDALIRAEYPPPPDDFFWGQCGDPAEETSEPKAICPKKGPSKGENVPTCPRGHADCGWRSSDK